MAKIQVERLIPHLIEQTPPDGPLGLLDEIFALQSKIENSKEADFYFQKGLENHKYYLEGMKNEYAKLVELINTNEVAYFVAQITHFELALKKVYAMENFNMISRIGVVAINSQITKYKNLLEIKIQYGQLKSLDELMQEEA